MSDLGFMCDFCGDPPTTLADCNTFDVDNPLAGILPMTSVGEFLCCDTCFAIVQKGDREALFQRSKTSFIQKQGYWMEGICDKLLRDFHNQFWENRKA